MEIQLQRSGFWNSFFGITLRKITGVEKKYVDQYRIRKLVLMDGEEKFYPEYRIPGITSDWEQIICINKKHYEVSNITFDEAFLTLEESHSYIVEFEKKLEKERAKLVLREEILPGR